MVPPGDPAPDSGRAPAIHEAFVDGDLAALRAAAALVAAHAKPSGRRPTSVWLLLPRVSWIARLLIAMLIEGILALAQASG